MIDHLILAAAAEGGLNDSAIMVAIVTATATLGASYLMFRGKTQDTANWLITELRDDAKAARMDAAEAKHLFAACELHRQEDRELHRMELDDLREFHNREMAELRRAVAALRARMTTEGDAQREQHDRDHPG